MIRAILLISVAIALVASVTDTKETEGLEQFVKNVQDRMEIPEDREEECEEKVTIRRNRCVCLSPASMRGKRIACKAPFSHNG